ncbi:MAG: carboxypeptidase-like regulatory domain-containing protein, partial [Gemmatimonadota bacterium]|nr:carboxypeptidase-like regulatory domain-containing protein [Gemmatimonadota bacterium]
MKRIALLVMSLSLLNAGGAAAQTRTVTGTVASAEDGQALSEATVQLVGTNRRTLTDPQGNFSLPVPAGAVRLQVTRVGYTSRTVTVAAGEN